MINIKYKLSALWYLEVFSRMYFLVYLIFIALWLVYISIHMVAFTVYLLCIIIYIYWIKKESESYFLETEIQITKDEIIRKNINSEIHIKLNHYTKFYNSINFYILASLDQLFIIPKKCLSRKNKELFLEIVENYNLDIENIKFFKFKMENYSVKIWFYLIDSQDNIITKQFLINNDDFEKFDNMYIIPKSNIWLLKFISLLNTITKDPNYILWQNVFLSSSLFLVSENKIKFLFLTLRDMVDIEKRNKINWNKNWKIEIAYGKYFIKFSRSWNNIILKTYDFIRTKKKKRLLAQYLIKDSKKFIREIGENIECYIKIKNLILKQDMSTQLMKSIDPKRLPEICKQRRNFVPWESVWPLKFGMNIEEVIKILRTKWRKFGVNYYTHFVLGFNIDYDQDYNIEFINNFWDVEIYFRNEKLFPNKFLKTINFLKNYDEAIPYKDWYIFYKLWISVERMDETQTDIENIWFWSKSYYEKFRDQFF